jgi:hypothetical protein
MIKVKFFSDLSKDGDFLRFVDFVSDSIDMVKNPREDSFDSAIVRAELERCGCEGPWTIIDGDVLAETLFYSGEFKNVSTIQYITVALENAEDYVKLRLLSNEIITKNPYSKEDLLC